MLSKVARRKLPGTAALRWSLCRQRTRSGAFVVARDSSRVPRRQLSSLPSPGQQNDGDKNKNKNNNSSNNTSNDNNNNLPARHEPPQSSSSVSVFGSGSEITVPIDFAVSSKIEGEESQIATVTLREGERLRAESGSMLFMTQGVEMATKLEGASSAFSRMMTGQNVFLTDFTYHGANDPRGTGSGTVGLGTDFPSKIIRLSLSEHGGSLVAQRGAFLASNPSVDIQMEFTRTMTAGFFGGQGFVLQRLVGDGDVLIKAGGTLVEKDLQEGEVLRVTSGSIVAFEPTVSYDIQMMQGVKNVVFGGEGLFVTTLMGPGRCWLQGMPPDRMIASIASRVPSGGGFGPVIPIGMGGGGAPPVDPGVPVGDADAVADAPPGTAVGPEDEPIAASSGEGLGFDVDPPPFGMSGNGNGNGNDVSSTTHSYSNAPGETESFQQPETTFTDDGTDFSEPTFSDDTSFSTDEGFGEPPSGFFEDDATEIFDSGAAEEASEAGRSILSTLWDIFTGD